MLIQSRRGFLRVGLQSAGALGAMARFGEMNAFAQGSGYKALVCVFLFGGNDCHNTVVPITTVKQNYAGYSGPRQGMGIAQNALLPFQNKAGETYGLHPKLKEMQSLYNNGKAAILSNVGMLVQPIANRQALQAGAPVPLSLYSHSDQQTQWQSAAPDGLLPTGWGGRLADSVLGQLSQSQFPPLVNTQGQALFCTGGNLNTVVTPGGMLQLGGMQNLPSRQLASQQLLTFDNGVKLVQAANTVIGNGQKHAGLLNGALATATPLQTAFPAGNLAAQLKMVARVMSVRQQLGASRQIFFVSFGGFDTHTAQLATQDALLGELSPAIDAFYKATVELGLDQNVTTFTSSEFGRTLMPNSSGGTDHAWGGHHFIVGGAVKGADMYGQFPLLVNGGQDDASGRGALIPSTSVDQYGATLAKWFGVQPGAAMSSVFPNLGAKFNPVDLGFLS